MEGGYFKYDPSHEKTRILWIRSGTNWPVQSQKQVRISKIRIQKSEIVLSFFFFCENKDADRLCRYCTADLRLWFRLCRLLVSWLNLPDKQIQYEYCGFLDFFNVIFDFNSSRLAHYCIYYSFFYLSRTILYYYLSRYARKPILWVFDQVRRKPVCAVTVLRWVEA